MIGKGKRSKAVMDSIVCNGAVYFAAVGEQEPFCPNAFFHPKLLHMKI